MADQLRDQFENPGSCGATYQWAVKFICKYPENADAGETMGEKAATIREKIRQRLYFLSGKRGTAKAIPEENETAVDVAQSAFSEPKAPVASSSPERVAERKSESSSDSDECASIMQEALEKSNGATLNPSNSLIK